MAVNAEASEMFAIPRGRAALLTDRAMTSSIARGTSARTLEGSSTFPLTIGAPDNAAKGGPDHNPVTSR